jgi:hypothetical protein
MRIKWLISIAGQCYGKPNGVKRGEVDDLPDSEARRMVASGYAQSNWRDEPGPPFQSSEATVTRGARRIWDGWRA